MKTKSELAHECAQRFEAGKIKMGEVPAEVLGAVLDLTRTFRSERAQTKAFYKDDT